MQMGVAVPQRPVIRIPLSLTLPEGEVLPATVRQCEAREDQELQPQLAQWRAAVIALYDEYTVDRFIDPGTGALRPSRASSEGIAQQVGTNGFHGGAYGPNCQA